MEEYNASMELLNKLMPISKRDLNINIPTDEIPYGILKYIQLLDTTLVPGLRIRTNNELIRFIVRYNDIFVTIEYDDYNTGRLDLSYLNKYIDKIVIHLPPPSEAKYRFIEDTGIRKASFTINMFSTLGVLPVSLDTLYLQSAGINLPNEVIVYPQITTFIVRGGIKPSAMKFWHQVFPNATFYRNVEGVLYSINSK